jgi:hypothetical protein
VLGDNTVIRNPHEVVVTRKAGRTHRDKVDPRVSVAMQEEGATLTLFFDPETALSGDAPLLEIRLTPTAGGEFEPWRLLPNLLLHVQYARAELAWDRDDASAALRALRQVSTTRRGLSDDFLGTVARLYDALIAEGEKYPVKTLAAAQHVDISTASRWVSAARARGLLGEDA